MPYGYRGYTSSSKGTFKKKVNGKSVMRDRTKAGLVGAGGALLFTPLGGELVGGAANNASANAGQAFTAVTQGAGGTSSQLSLSSSSIALVVLGFVLMSGRRRLF